MPVQWQIIRGNFAGCVRQMYQRCRDGHAPTQVRGRFRRIELKSHGVILPQSHRGCLYDGISFVGRTAAISYPLPPTSGRNGIHTSFGRSLNDVCQFQGLARCDQARTGCEQEHQYAFPLCRGIERSDLSLLVAPELAGCCSRVFGIPVHELCEFVLQLFVWRFLRWFAMPPYPGSRGVMEWRCYRSQHRRGCLDHFAVGRWSVFEAWSISPDEGVLYALLYLSTSTVVDYIAPC